MGAAKFPFSPALGGDEFEQIFPPRIRREIRDCGKQGSSGKNIRKNSLNSVAQMLHIGEKTGSHR